SAKSSEPARRLAQLARMARGEPPSAAALLALDSEFAAAFAGYQREFGCRGLGYEPAEPTLAESPALVLGLIRDQIARGYDPAADEEALRRVRAEALNEARAALAGRSRDRAPALRAGS